MELDVTVRVVAGSASGSRLMADLLAHGVADCTASTIEKSRTRSVGLGANRRSAAVLAGRLSARRRGYGTSGGAAARAGIGGRSSAGAAGPPAGATASAGAAGTSTERRRWRGAGTAARRRRERRGRARPGAAARRARRVRRGRGGTSGRRRTAGGRRRDAAARRRARARRARAARAPATSYVSGVTVTVHAQTRTILVVTWTQAMAADTTWLEFSFAGSSVMTSRAAGRARPARTATWCWACPASTAVTVRIVSKQGGVDYKTRDYMGTTGALPTRHAGADDRGATTPRSPAPIATCSAPSRTPTAAAPTRPATTTRRSGSTSWTARAASSGTTPTPASNATSSFQRIARDGEYIWIEKRPFGGSGTRSVLKMTLDRQYSETIAVPGLSDCIDVTTDGSLLYDAQQRAARDDQRRRRPHDLELPDRVRHAASSATRTRSTGTRPTTPC